MNNKLKGILLCLPLLIIAAYMFWINPVMLGLLIGGITLVIIGAMFFKGLDLIFKK